MIYIGGHSLGAARAWLYAFSRLQRGLPVHGVYALAPPKPGNAGVGVGCYSLQVAISVKNRVDFVTDVPPSVEGMIYEQPRWFFRIDEEGAWDDVDLAFKDHHIGLYVAGCHKLPEPPTDASLSLADAADQIARLYVDEDPAHWTWAHFVDGEFCAAQKIGDDWLVVFRGTKTAHEWVQDFDFRQINVLGAKVSEGFWAGVAAVEAELDKLLEGVG